MANTKTQQNTFKISDLDEIDIKHIDDKDSFLITDYNGKNKFTKRITMKKLMNVIANNKQLIQQLLEDDDLDQSIQTKVDEKIDKATLAFDTINGGDAIDDD